MTNYPSALDQAWLGLWVDKYGPGSRLQRYLRRPTLTGDERAAIIDRSVSPDPPRPRPQIARLTRDLGETVNLFLETVLNVQYDDQELTRYQKRGNVHRTNLVHVGKHLRGVDFYFMDDLSDRMSAGGRYVDDADRVRYLLSSAREQVDVFWPLDFAVAQGTIQDDPDDLVFVIKRFRTLSPPEVRGMPIRTILPRMGLVAFEMLNLRKQHVRRPDALIFGLVKDSWKSIEDDIVTSDMGEFNSFHDQSIRSIFAAKLNARYSWHVAFGSEPGSRAVLPTNPRGCLELFRGRDLSPGARRRSALRHWVNEHYRDRSDDPGALVYICEHLRGNTRFTWNGIACELMVSEYDLERSEFLKSQAFEWRAVRSHNRVKVRLKERRR